MVTVLRSGHFDNTAGDKNKRKKRKSKLEKSQEEKKVRETDKFRWCIFLVVVIDGIN